MSKIKVLDRDMTPTRLAGLWLLLFSPGQFGSLTSIARAEQFVLFDVTFTYTKQDADNSKPSKSHFYVKDNLVIKDDSGGQGHAHKRVDHANYFPTKVRITMVQVSAGSTYDPSQVPHLLPK